MFLGRVFQIIKHVFKIRKLFPEPAKMGNFSRMEYPQILRNIHPCTRVIGVTGASGVRVTWVIGVKVNEVMGVTGVDYVRVTKVPGIFVVLLVTRVPGINSYWEIWDRVTWVCTPGPG